MKLLLLTCTTRRELHKAPAPLKKPLIPLIPALMSQSSLTMFHKITIILFILSTVVYCKPTALISSVEDKSPAAIEKAGMIKSTARQVYYTCADLYAEGNSCHDNSCSRISDFLCWLICETCMDYCNSEGGTVNGVLGVFCCKSSQECGNPQYNGCSER